MAVVFGFAVDLLALRSGKFRVAKWKCSSICPFVRSEDGYGNRNGNRNGNEHCCDHVADAAADGVDSDDDSSWLSRAEQRREDC